MEIPKSVIDQIEKTYEENPDLQTLFDSIDGSGRSKNRPRIIETGIAAHLPDKLDIELGTKVFDSCGEDATEFSRKLANWVAQNRLNNEIIRRLHYRAMIEITGELIAQPDGLELLQKVSDSLKISLTATFAFGYLYRVLELKQARNKNAKKDLQTENDCGTVESRNEHEAKLPDGVKELDHDLREKLAAMEGLSESLKEKLLDPGYTVGVANLADLSDTRSAAEMLDLIDNYTPIFVDSADEKLLSVEQVFERIGNGFVPVDTHPMLHEKVSVKCNNLDPKSATKVNISGWAVTGPPEYWEPTAREYLKRLEQSLKAGYNPLPNDGRVIRGFESASGIPIFFHESELCTCGMSEEMCLQYMDYLLGRSDFQKFLKTDRN